FASDLDPEVSDVLGVFVVGEWGGALGPLASAGHDPDWSPKGELVAYATWEGDGGIMVTPPLGDPYVAVEEAFPSNPDWSPDGTRIAFIGDTIGSRTLNVVFLPSRGLDTMARNAAGFIQWSPSGDRIAYTATSGDKADLFISSVGESPGSIAKAQRIATDGSVSYPAWSPDGTQLAFVSRKEGNRNIYVATLACTDAEEACHVNVRQVTDAPDAETNPIWFPDGNHLVYLAGRGSSWHLEMVDLDNQHPQLLVDGLTSPRELDGHIE
ncbi:MAG: LpqB family beta-propeller domain-containing protein, partial [Anaerolineales bacterium]|nr:LpqB family beta-propeller domain-containing protein [Anaerolineales bacterium]